MYLNNRIMYNELGGVCMKKRYTLIVLLLVLYFICTVQVFASRSSLPAKISPVIYNDLRIVAENNSSDNMGIVQAFNVNTNKLIWSKKIYKVEIKSGIEEDTQWIFIKEIKIDNDKLLVVNESNKIYEVDPNTGKVLNDNNWIVISVLSLIIITLFIVTVYMYRRRR